MYRLKLIKGLSYSGGDIKATKKKPYITVEDETIKDWALASGYFELVEETEKGHLDRDQLATMETDNLKKLAGDMEINAPENKDALVEAIATVEVEPGPVQYGGKQLKDMTKAELETFATYKGIALKGNPTKAAIIKILKAELPEEETTGLIYYGSPTMVELQEEL